jgi:hypothetical protein
MKKDNRIRGISLRWAVMLGLILALNVLAGRIQAKPYAQESPTHVSPATAPDELPFLDTGPKATPSPLSSQLRYLQLRR